LLSPASQRLHLLVIACSTSCFSCYLPLLNKQVGRAAMTCSACICGHFEGLIPDAVGRECSFGDEAAAAPPEVVQQLMEEAAELSAEENQ
jgi:hypothetical protein